MSTKALNFTCTIKTTAADVYYAFTNSTALQQWVCDISRSTNGVNGPYLLTWNSGYYAVWSFIELQENEKIVFTWQGKDDPGITQVMVTLAEKGENTEITLEHSGIGTGDGWQHAIPELQKGWDSGLENLQSVLETGVDLRFMHQPLLGIFSAGAIDTAKAEELGIPSVTGMLISGTAEGTGAEAIGLEKNDVISKIDGVAIVTGAELGQILSSKNAGDEVEVVFYRKGHEFTIRMHLSGRQTPHLPASPAEHASKMQAGYDSAAVDLAELLDGVTEAEAEHKPAPAEWNIKEVMAHLIWTERFFQMYLWSMIGGNGNVSFPDNNAAQLIAILTTHSTLPQLLTELKESEKAVAAIFAALPEEFQKRKGSYMQVTLYFMNAGLHQRSHFEQIQNAIDDARK